MKKVLSMLFIMLLVFQPALIFVLPANLSAAENGESRVIQDVRYEDSTGTLVDLETTSLSAIMVTTVWSLENTAITDGYQETYQLPDKVTNNEVKSGVLMNSENDLEIGTYKVTTDGLIAVVFNSNAVELNANGQFSFEVQVDNGNQMEEVNSPDEQPHEADQLGDEQTEEPDLQGDASEQVGEEIETDPDLNESTSDQTIDETETESDQVTESDTEHQLNDIDQTETSLEDESSEEGTFEALEISESILTNVSLKQRFEDGSESKELIPGNEIVVDNPYSNFKVELKYDFALPNGHSYGAGSTYTITIPNQFSIQPNPEPISLKRPDGLEFGSFTVTSNNQIIITFNENIETNSNISGFLTLSSEFDQHYAGSAEGEAITFPLEDGSTISFPVKFIPNGSSIDKRGEADKSYNAKTITWTVDFNKDLQTIENATITDELTGDGAQQFVAGSLKVYKIHMNADGSIDESKTTELTGHSFGTSFPLNLGTIDSAYRLVYETEITDNTGTNYWNNATLNGDNIEKASASASVAVKRGQPLEKRAVGYDAATQTIKWEIKYNYDEKEIEESKAVLQDVLGENQQLVSGSLEVVEVEIDPETGNETATTPFTDYNVDPASTDFELSFHQAIDKAYKITYETTAVDRVEENATITNKVSDQFGNETEAQQGITQQIFHKWNNDNANYDAKTTSWTMAINRDKYTMENVVLTDKLPKGFTPRDVVVKHGEEGWNETEDYSYTFDSYSQMITIEFGQPLTDRVEITYTTDIDFNQVDSDRSSFTNTAFITWNPEGESTGKSKTDSATFTPDNFTVNNGFKGGSYNPVTKTIDWEIGVNYNLVTMENAVVEDYIIGDQNFDINTVKVYHMDLTGGSNGIEQGEELDSAEYEVESIADDDGNQGFKVTLHDIDSPYKIVYQTDLIDQLVADKYENTATVTSDNRDTYELHASVSPDYGGEYTNKTAEQNSSNPRVVNWSVRINYAQSTVSNVSITDTPSVNQSLRKDSIKLYDTNVTTSDISKGELLEEGTDYTLTFHEEENGVVSFTLDFIEETIDTAYVLEYDTYIMFKDDGYIENTIRFNGDQTEEVPTDNSLRKAINFSQIGGGIDGKVGNLTVTKVDADDQSPLPGAEFTLYDKDGEQVIYTETTEENGQVTFHNLLYGDYVLKESNAPSGYVVGITDQQTVTIDKDSINLTIENKKNIRGVELTKVDAETKEPLDGVVFQLVDAESNQIVLGYENLVTDEHGKIILSELDPGDYRLEEVTPQLGYKKMESPLEFTITATQTEVIQLEAENDIIKGSIQLNKVDGDNNNAPLAGVEFQLEDEEGNLIERDGSTTFTTDENGEIVIHDLRPGNYQFMEQKTLEHYQLMDTPIPFVIERAQSETAKLTIPNYLITGSVQLTKLAEGSDKPLAGAVFEIRQGDAVIKDNLVTDSDGKVVVDDLTPGEYQFVEVKAPAGYHLDRTPIDFTIELSQTEIEELVVYNKKRVSSGGGSNNPGNNEDGEDPGNEDGEDPGNNDGEVPGNENEDGSDKTDDGLQNDGSDNELSGNNGNNQGTEGTEEDNNKNSSEKQQDHSLANNHELPNTATNVFNIVLAGFVLLASGLILLLSNKRRQSK
ncbi:LPXTG cell wall anchor domain-containing protein [Gracilibacillus oryzae]|uniref:LPXTG cell wall anchor domain-containing protein n=1 Tax=Gracilibacillus oryzae TaxID=1672701 RepID=A0A7C8GVE5_9BACI|nr:collagen binding domain-containing protein [Gracilibacillus oryzae]KAB8138047.1 LPXTG cell wall anchor domain-containing protein [Gracilibacillus oryzae]